MPSAFATTNAVNPPSSSALAGIRAAFFQDWDPVAVLSGRTAAVDRTVVAAFDQYLAPVYPSGLALLAVGGYGRQELFPNSDVDLLLLLETAPHNQITRDALSTFLRTLWDAGLRLSHSVHSLEECCQYHPQNVELNISLLDQRYLCGDRAEYDKLAGQLPKFVMSERPTLVRHLIRQVRERHEKFHSTVYHLEPNVKEAPGGLRDIHSIGWLTKLQDPDRELPDWLAELAEPCRFLYATRCYLHWQANRDQNLLQFDLQESLAAERGLTPAEFVRQYFLSARKIHRGLLQAVDLCETLVPSGLLGRFRDWRSRLSTSEISVNKDRLYLKNAQLLESDPDVALRLIRFSARHGLPLSADAERRLEAALPTLAAHFAQPGPVWNYLREIFEQPHAMAALRTMHESGLLAAILPEWKLIEGLVVRDFYHRYTVDEHTLIVMENLLALRTNADPARRRFAGLFAEIQSLPALLFAILMHDVGKGIDGPTHAMESARLAAAIMERIQVPEEERPLIHFLIDQHLALSSVMNSRDLSDPATAEHLAGRVETVERLRYLTLLTYADISGVNATSMSPWRLEQLWRVYAVGQRELTRELDTDRIGASASHPFLEGFPQRYLRTHREAEVAQHIALAEKASQSGVAIDLSRQGGVWNLVVITRDRPKLFASLAGALAGSGMNIVKAEAFANHRGEVLDSFTFADPNRNLELNPPEIERLCQTIERVVLGKLNVANLLASRRPSPAGKAKPDIRPVVHVDNQVSDHATLVEISAEDRPGLLFDLASTISQTGCNIEVVLIDTEAHKAIDVFYLTREDRKLSAEESVALERRLDEVCRRF
ncbi:MAG: ACT domain-containing protein [Acidobacteriota bacterium]